MGNPIEDRLDRLEQFLDDIARLADDDSCNPHKEDQISLRLSTIAAGFNANRRELTEKKDKLASKKREVLNFRTKINALSKPHAPFFQMKHQELQREVQDLKEKIKKSILSPERLYWSTLGQAFQACCNLIERFKNGGLGLTTKNDLKTLFKHIEDLLLKHKLFADIDAHYQQAKTSQLIQSDTPEDYAHICNQVGSTPSSSPTPSTRSSDVSSLTPTTSTSASPNSSRSTSPLTTPTQARKELDDYTLALVASKRLQEWLAWYLPNVTTDDFVKDTLQQRFTLSHDLLQFNANTHHFTTLTQDQYPSAAQRSQLLFAFKQFKQQCSRSTQLRISDFESATVDEQLRLAYASSAIKQNRNTITLFSLCKTYLEAALHQPSLLTLQSLFGLPTTRGNKHLAAKRPDFDHKRASAATCLLWARSMKKPGGASTKTLESVINMQLRR